MSILQTLPFSRCQPGPEEVDGIGNYCLQIFAPTPSQRSLSTLYFLDSHGQIPSKLRDPDYEAIEQSQVEWFKSACQTQRDARKKSSDGGSDTRLHLSLAFFHIPLPEFGDRHLQIRSGHRREPTECPSVNSHFYDALAEEGVSAVGCGHDHVNDFCALLPPQTNQQNNSGKPPRPQQPGGGLWLCYAGGSGFGGYSSYDGKRFHRRMRVWELDTSSGSLKTWKRVEYAADRIDEMVLVEGGAVVDITRGPEDEEADAV